MSRVKTLAATVLAVVLATPVGAQTTSQEPVIAALQDGNAYLRDMVTKAAGQMSDEDYTFRPTSEIRSFGQILAHIADTNFVFCSAAKGEKPPIRGIEKTSQGRTAIQKALAESFEYCDSAYANVTPDAAEIVDFNGKKRTPFVVLTFRNYHGLLHYGNVITYMRLRGKIPPSSQLTEMK